MMKTIAMPEVQTTDADLVARSLSGSRDAFGLIVSRYQSLICSLAYSATGRLSQSEDLAQETFLAAWKQLGNLREPGKLRSWLCGIARNLIHNTLRREGRNPASAADALEGIEEPIATEPEPADQAISREEEQILWRSLERIPEAYREPLVLYYREHQSMEHVAVALDVSEEVVRQRLSRGRKMLQEQVLSFVEGALGRTSPGKAFTLGVLASLPSLATSATAATISAGAAKGSALAKTASYVAWINLLIGPLVGCLSCYFGVKANLNLARTQRERRCIIRQMKKIIAGALVFTAGLIGVVQTGRFWVQHPIALAAAGCTLLFGFSIWMAHAMSACMRELRMLRHEERQLHPELFKDGAGREQRAPIEYRSDATCLGIPLVHIRLDTPAPNAPPVVAWIAAGDRVIGILLAFGGMSVGTISVGVLSAGLISVGTVSVGPISMGTIAIGLLSLGAMAVGNVAFGSFAAGWTGAAGGLAVAHEYAAGAQAIGQYVNDAAARDFFASNHLAGAFHIMFFVMAVLVLVPGALFAWRSGKRLRSKAS